MCKFVRPSSRSACLIALALVSAPGIAATEPGGLDRTVEGTPTSPPVDIERLQDEVQAEQAALETLPRAELEDRAESGERAAQVALGTDFAREATLLAFAPAAANDALADAARWYSLAASRGFPGAPSLDQAGVRFYPIRIQRERRPN